MGGGCDWLGIGWRYDAKSAEGAQFFVSAHEADDERTIWHDVSASTNPPPPLETSAHQARLTGLRADRAYEIRIAASDGGRRSAWVTGPRIRTDSATGIPEPPLEPIVLSSSESSARASGMRSGMQCSAHRIRLPLPQSGCHSPTDATLQYQMGSASGDGEPEPWVDEPFTTSEMDLSQLVHANASYNFRLVAHNGAGSSHPGTATTARVLCAALEGEDESSLRHGALVRGVMIHAPGVAMPLAGLAAVACAALLFYKVRRRAREGGRRGSVSGGKYERASVLPPEEDPQHHEQGHDSDDGGGEPGSCGAYDEWSQTLCVHVFVPASSRPVRIEMSTADVTSSLSLLQQLRLVVSEVAGRQPALTADEVIVVYEGRGGVQQDLRATSVLQDVLKSNRVVARVSGAAPGVTTRV